MRVELRVAAMRQADEAVVEPHFDTTESDRIKVNGDELAAQVGGHFPDRCPQGNGGVFANPAGQSHQEESFDIDARGESANGGAELSKTLGGGFALKAVVLGLVIGGFDPSPVSAIEFIESVDGLKKKCWQELGLSSEKIPFNFTLRPGVVGLGVNESYAQVGANGAQVLAAKSSAIVGVQFIEQPACQHGLAEAIQEVLESFAWIELGVDAEAGAIVQKGEEEGALGFAVGEFDGRTVHAIAHPQQVGQRERERLGGAVDEAGTCPQTAPIQAGFAQASMQGAKAEGAVLEESSAQQLLNEGFEGENGMLTADLEQRFEGLRVNGAMLATIATGLVMQGSELTIAMAIKPSFDRGGGIESTLPSVLGS